MTSTSTRDLVSQPYKYGFVTEIETEKIAKGLSEEVVRLISAKKEEPDFLLEFRLKAFRHWLTLEEPDWASLGYPPIDYQDIVYYAAPKQQEAKKASLDEVDPKLLETFDKLGIPLSEQKRLSNVAVDAVFDSVSIATTYKEKLAEHGVVFCSFSEAVKEHPELIGAIWARWSPAMTTISPPELSGVQRRILRLHSEGRRVPDGAVHVLPDQLRRYRTVRAHLDRCRGRASVSYLEGCTAPMFDTNQLHAAVVELVALDDASIKYSTVQNWYAGDENGVGGIYNFVTKRGQCRGDRSRISWTQVETGSAITWKYPSCVLQGADSVGEFYSVALTNNCQQADTGTKMVHVGPRTRSTIVSKGISAEVQQQLPRAGADGTECQGRPQLQPVRFDADWRSSRRQHLSLYPIAAAQCGNRA